MNLEVYFGWIMSFTRPTIFQSFSFHKEIIKNTFSLGVVWKDHGWLLCIAVWSRAVKQPRRRALGFEYNLCGLSRPHRTSGEFTDDICAPLLWISDSEWVGPHFEKSSDTSYIEWLLIADSTVYIIFKSSFLQKELARQLIFLLPGSAGELLFLARRVCPELPPVSCSPWGSSQKPLRLYWLLRIKAHAVVENS